MNISPITILLVDDNIEHNDTIRKMLSFEPDFQFLGAETNGKDAVDAAKRLKPDIILMDINMPDMDGLEATRHIAETVPHANIIMMTVQDGVEYVKRAMFAGARDYLTKPIHVDELYAAIRRVHALPRRMVEPDPNPTPTRRGKIIVVYSPQGGAGCTTLAVNLACGLMNGSRKVLLVDTDLQLGDVDVLLYMQAGKTFADLIESAGDLDLDFAEHIIPAHNSGLKILMGVGDLTDALSIRTQQWQSVRKVIEQLAVVFDYVVVDTSAFMDDLNAGLFEAADHMVLVGLPDLSSARRMRKVLDLLDTLGDFREKLTLVLNAMPDERKRPKYVLTPEKISKFLGHPVAAEITSDPDTLKEAALKGVPAVAYDPKQKRTITQHILALVERLQQTVQDKDALNV